MCPTGNAQHRRQVLPIQHSGHITDAGDVREIDLDPAGPWGVRAAGSTSPPRPVCSILRKRTIAAPTCPLAPTMSTLPAPSNHSIQISSNKNGTLLKSVPRGNFNLW